jgi:hypothetical protein
MNFSIPDEKEIRTSFAEGEEAVVALFGGVTAQVEELAAQLEKQAGMLKDLQARLSKNSRNSGKPPSGDGYGKKNRTESLRKSGQKPNGGQPDRSKRTPSSFSKLRFMRSDSPPRSIRSAFFLPLLCQRKAAGLTCP